MVTVIASHSTALAALCRKPSQSALNPLSIRFFIRPSRRLLSPVRPLSSFQLGMFTLFHTIPSMDSRRANCAPIISALRSGIGVKGYAPQAGSRLCCPHYLNLLRNNTNPSRSHHTRCVVYPSDAPCSAKRLPYHRTDNHSTTT